MQDLQNRYDEDILNRFPRHVCPVSPERPCPSFSMIGPNKISILLSFWTLLEKVSQFTLSARSYRNEEVNWDGKGKIVITKQGNKILIFKEKGTWHSKKVTEINFSNVYRWTLDRENCVISLDHLRQGFNHPVFLFYLVPAGTNSLSSIDPHICGEDTYFGQIHFDSYSLRLNWRVIGPKKNEELNCYYS